MENNSNTPPDRASLVLAKLNNSVHNKPIFQALAEAFADCADATRDRRERAHLNTMSESCQKRYDQQKARSDLSPTWER